MRHQIGSETTEGLIEAEEALREGRTADAIHIYRTLLSADPAHPEAWFNLGWAERANRQFDAALFSYAQALAYGIANPEDVLLNRAVIFSEYLFDPDQALSELGRAVETAPDFVAGWLNMGNIYEDLGRRDDARAAYRRVLAIDPANGRAHARLGAIDVFAGRAADAAADLTTALATAPSLDARADILFSLGAALDSLADYDGAFQAYEAANWMARATAPAAYDAAAQENLVARIMQAYPAARPAGAAPADAPYPIFVCGMFRSGSTLAEQILGRHSAITAAGELDLVPAFARRLQPYPEAAATLDPAAVEALRAEYIGGLPTASGHVTDKRCDNVLHLGLIKTLFPAAKIVHTRRGALDNILSVYFLHFGDEVAYGHALDEATHYYIQYRRLIAHWRTLYPGDIYDLDYDALVTDPRETVAGMLHFLGLEWEDACLTPTASSGAVRTASAWQTRLALHARSSGRWRNYERHLDGVRRMLADAGL